QRLVATEGLRDSVGAQERSAKIGHLLVAYRLGDRTLLGLRSHVRLANKASKQPRQSAGEGHTADQQESAGDDQAELLDVRRLVHAELQHGRADQRAVDTRRTP